MTYAPTRPVDVPPYQVQDLISPVIEEFNPEIGAIHVRCAQATDSEIYVGSSNGQLVCFALRVDVPEKHESYEVVSRQFVPNGKPIDEIVLVPCHSRAIVLSGT